MSTIDGFSRKRTRANIDGFIDTLAEGDIGGGGSNLIFAEPGTNDTVAVDQNAAKKMRLSPSENAFGGIGNTVLKSDDGVVTVLPKTVCYIGSQGGTAGNGITNILGAGVNIGVPQNVGGTFVDQALVTNVNGDSVYINGGDDGQTQIALDAHDAIIAGAMGSSRLSMFENGTIDLNPSNHCSIGTHNSDSTYSTSITGANITIGVQSDLFSTAMSQTVQIDASNRIDMGQYGTSVASYGASGNGMLCDSTGTNLVGGSSTINIADNQIVMNGHGGNTQMILGNNTASLYSDSTTFNQNSDGSNIMAVLNTGISMYKPVYFRNNTINLGDGVTDPSGQQNLIRNQTSVTSNRVVGPLITGATGVNLESYDGNPTTIVCIKGLSTSGTVGGTVNYTSGDGRLYVVSSALRFKQNIRDLSTKYTKEQLLNLRPVLYNPIEEGKQDVECIGFIAEEVDEIVPEIVVRDGEGQVQTISYPTITALLMQIVKEQQAEIDEIKTQLNII